MLCYYYEAFQQTDLRKQHKTAVNHVQSIIPAFFNYKHWKKTA